VILLSPPEEVNETVALSLTVNLFIVALVFTEIAAFVFITTSCELVGTKLSDQFPAVFQLLLTEPSHVLVCPHELLALSRKISKNTAEKQDRCRRKKFRKI
jgi:hypothetical protein